MKNEIVKVRFYRLAKCETCSQVQSADADTKMEVPRLLARYPEVIGRLPGLVTFARVDG
jgi:hypothetical protein